jgi:hypothetical protein
MVGLKLWNGSAWVNVSRVPGARGPVGDVATDTSPAGPAGGGLANRYPNPEVNRIAAGTLLDAWRLDTGVAAASAVWVATPAAGAAFPWGVFTCTPIVDSWLEVDAVLGLLGKNDAAYHQGYLGLRCAPADVDGFGDRWTVKTQHSTVQLYESRTIRHVYNLVSGTAYTLSMLWSATGGTWQYNNGPHAACMSGKLWAK